MGGGGGGGREREEGTTSVNVQQYITHCPTQGFLYRCPIKREVRPCSNGTARSSISTRTKTTSGIFTYLFFCSSKPRNSRTSEKVRWHLFRFLIVLIQVLLLLFFPSSFFRVVRLTGLKAPTNNNYVTNILVPVGFCLLFCSSLLVFFFFFLFFF